MAHSDTGDGADGDRAERGDRTTGRGDGDQTGDRAGGGAQRGERAVADLLVDEPGQHGGGGGDLRVDEHQRADAVVVAEPRAGVEAEPAEPQQTGAEHDQREAVRAHRVLLEADALADDQDHAERRGTRVDVDRRTTGEVDHAQLEGPAAGAPDPVGDREVDDRGPQGDEQRPGRELHAVREGAADQGGRDDRRTSAGRP